MHTGFGGWKESKFEWNTYIHGAKFAIENESKRSYDIRNEPKEFHTNAEVFNSEWQSSWVETCKLFSSIFILPF